MLLFPLPFARNKENGNIESNTNRLCTMHYEAGLYSVGCKETIAVYKFYFAIYYTQDSRLGIATRIVHEWYGRGKIWTYLTSLTIYLSIPRQF